VVVTTAGWWQGRPVPMESLYGFAEQSLISLEGIADAGATIILTGNLPGGIYPAMREYMRTTYTLEDLANLLYQGGTLGFVAILMSIRFKLQQAKYRMMAAVEGVDAGTLQDLGFETASSATQALSTALARYDPDAKVAVLPALGCPNWPVVA
jgi:hypothetical protein